LDLKELKELLEIISERDISEFELEEEGIKLKIKKGAAAKLSVSDNNHQVSPPAVATPEAFPAPVAVAASVEAEPDPGLVVVRSPMVGTFYRAPEPNAPPFVNVGDRVKLGQVLCIIEAMKLMNEIESETTGDIVRILAENGQPVQYGDELFHIRLAM
jgi:oxaloacetate decarboxylase alpha subunit